MTANHIPHIHRTEVQQKGKKNKYNKMCEKRKKKQTFKIYINEHTSRKAKPPQNFSLFQDVSCIRI